MRRQPATGMLVRHDRPPAAVVVATLAELQSLVAGRLVRALRLSNGVVAYVAHDTSGLPVNHVASWLANELGCGLGLDEFLHGPAVIFGCLNADGEWDGLEYECPSGVREMLEREETDNVAVHTQGLLFCR